VARAARMGQTPEAEIVVVLTRASSLFTTEITRSMSMSFSARRCYWIFAFISRD
jgi:hypothetical protein